MPISFPSKVITILDVPEVRNFNAKFNYNFFVPDEKVSDTGDRRAYGTSTGKEREDFLSRKIPRWVEFSFEPVDVQTNASVDNEFVAKISRPEDVRRLLAKNYWRIQNETDVTTKGYSALNTQDRKIAMKAGRLITRSMWMRAKSAGVPRSRSRTEIAELLNDVTSDWIKGKWILRCLGGMSYFGYYSYSTRYRRRVRHGRRWTRWLGRISHYSQFSDKFLGTVLNKSMSGPFNPFSGEFAWLRRKATEAQEHARLQNNPGVITDYEYSTNLRPISIKRIDASEFKNAVKVIGYIIDKTEIYPNGYRRRLQPVILASSTIGGGLDSKVKYGHRYAYSIRAIALAQFQAVDEETGQIFAITGLISSRPSRWDWVRCKEYNPPPPPADLNFIWDYKKKRMMLMWSFPVVSTRDVKRFQVLRRKSIHEPYQLLAEYDFDDSVLPTPRKETPRPTRTHTMENPSTTYVDEEFTRDSKFIYTLCSIDAHDFSSNYSQQFVVSFDRYKNRIVKKIISPEGAPKAYPNFYLTADPELGVGDINLTSDSIKDSGHKKCTIFFDPEYLSIVNGDEEDLRLLSFSDNENEGRYKFQMINIDRQKSQVMSIDIEDLRTKK